MQRNRISIQFGTAQTGQYGKSVCIEKHKMQIGKEQTAECICMVELLLNLLHSSFGNSLQQAFFQGSRSAG